jgi:hypothetical protein
VPTTVINQAAAQRDPTNNGRPLRVLLSAPAAAPAAGVLSGVVPTLA